MDSNPGGVGLLGSVERCVELGGRDVAAVAVQPDRVVPVDPAEGGQLDVVDRLPWPPAMDRPADDLALVEAVDALSERIVPRRQRHPIPPVVRELFG